MKSFEKFRKELDESAYVPPPQVHTPPAEIRPLSIENDPVHQRRKSGERFRRAAATVADGRKKAKGQTPRAPKPQVLAAKPRLGAKHSTYRRPEPAEGRYRF